MEVALYWLAATPEWELKEVLCLHARFDAEQVARLRDRFGENSEIVAQRRLDARHGPQTRPLHRHQALCEGRGVPPASP